MCCVFSGLQKNAGEPGVSAVRRITNISGAMWRNEGIRSFYKGLTPRILRVAPGQAVVFAVYERVSTWMESIKLSSGDDDTWSE